MTTCGELIPVLVARLGIEHAFGIPGNHTREIYRGLATSGLVHVTSRHEQGAGFMADGYARICGKPAVCFLITGPGLLNAATAIAQAASDGVPMLIIVSANPPSDESNGRLHEMRDQPAAIRAITGAVLQVKRADEVGGVLGDAGARLYGGRPGPVVVQIATDVLAQEVDAATQIDALGRRESVSSEIAPDVLDEVAAAVGSARQPLLLLGGGAIDAAGNVRKLAQRMDAPVINTVAAKGVMPASHPLSVGGSPSLTAVRNLMRDADLIVALGTELAETDYDLVMQGDLPTNARLVRVDIEAAQLQRNMRADYPVVADADRFCAALLDRLPAAVDLNGALRARTARAAIEADEHFHPDLAAFFATLRAAAPRAIVVGDSTRPTYYASWMLECEAPRRYCHCVSGFGTLGYALPAGIGAALSGEDPALVIIGDGGLQFTIAELGVAVAQNLCLPILVWRNRGYEEIEHSFAGAGVPRSVTAIGAPDLARIAAAYEMRSRGTRQPCRVARCAGTCAECAAADAHRDPAGCVRHLSQRAVV